MALNFDTIDINPLIELQYNLTRENDKKEELSSSLNKR